MTPSAEIVNTGVWVVIAMVNLITGYLAYRTHITAVQTNANVATIERATNSMKDALVASTAKASYAEGQAVGRLAQREDAAAAAEATKS